MQDQCLIWDFEGTLAYREGMWSQAVVDVVNRNFKEISLIRADVSDHLSSGFFWHCPETPHLHASNPKIWWEHHNEIFENAIVKTTSLTRSRVRQILPQIRKEYLKPSSWTVYSDVLSNLSELSTIGWKHVVLSNHVPELSDLIERLGLLHLFEMIVTSANIGYEKPNRLAYESVIRNLPSKSKLWMIGDNYTADVLGANRVGISAILVRRKNKYAKHFAESLDDVRGILELN